MPVILDADRYGLWLDTGMKDVREAPDQLQPYDARLMCCYPVSSRINHVVNDDADCSRHAEPTATRDRLFS